MQKTRNKKTRKQKRISPATSLIKNGKNSQKAFSLGLLRISYMGMQKRKDRLPLLAKLAKHKEPIIRSRAIWSIGAIGDKAGLPAVRRALNDPNESVRKTAENALIAISKKKVKK